MALAAVNLGHDVTMVCGSYGLGNTGINQPFKNGRRSGLVDGFKVIEFDLTYSNNDNFISRTLSFLRFALRSIRIALFSQYDLIFATSTPLTAGIPGVFARWLRGKTFIFEVRDLWPELPKAMGVISNPLILALMSFLEWVSYRSAHRLIGLSPGICEGIVQKGVKKSRVKLVPNGCDLNIFSSKPLRNYPITGISDNDFVAVFTGTHGPANGLDAVLDAAKVLIESKYKKIKILLIGDGKLKSSLKKRAYDENIENVIFMDPVPKAELASIMTRANIGMQILADVPAFYFGTSPNKFFDYLASGLPVLNNYPGWLAEMINEFDCGYTINPNDPQAFANALLDASQNSEKLASMGKNSKKLAIEKFDRKKLSSEWVNWVTENNT